MKVCTKCKVEKELTEFRERKNRKVGYYSRCRRCEVDGKRDWYYNNKQRANSYTKEYRKNILMDGKWRVYTLPNSNYYVGYSSCIYNRMSVHRSTHKRNTDDYIILHTLNTKEEAEWYEKVYHDVGFPGEHIGKYGHKKSPTKR